MIEIRFQGHDWKPYGRTRPGETVHDALRRARADWKGRVHADFRIKTNILVPNGTS